MKVTNLEFKVCDVFGMKDSPDGAWKEDVKERTEPIYSQKDIEDKINEVLKKIGKNFVDMKIDFKTIHTHNNGGCDTIYEFVTILSRDED